jgi:hypothetical protein
MAPESEKSLRVLVGKPEGKRRKWEDNIKTDIKEIGGVYLIHPAGNRDKWQSVVNKIIDNFHRRTVLLDITFLFIYQLMHKRVALKIFQTFQTVQQTHQLGHTNIYGHTTKLTTPMYFN